LGEDKLREGLLKTPERASKAMKFLTEGYEKDPKQILQGAMFEENYNEMVIVKEIELYSLCEHHLLPFMGHIHIAYIPKDKVVGLSKFGRVVDAISHRLQVQERLTSEVADAFYCSEDLAPKGVAVTCTAKHSCMCLRGIRKQDPETTTSAYRGVFKDKEVKKEYMNMLTLG
jgi:GTP cyclohydrolase I